MAEKESVIQLLKQIQDPELKRSIVSLGMVKEVKVAGSNVVIQLEMTTSSEKVRRALSQEIESKVQALEGVERVDVQFLKAPSRGGMGFQSKPPLQGIKHIVAVGSGKGGVGKSTVTANLAAALSQKGLRVGLVDGDIYGPNIPLMLGISPEARPVVGDDERIQPIQAYGISVISMGLLVPGDQPMVWRGPMLHSAVQQMVHQVAWNELDYLLVDLPPGTGDVQLSLVQTVPLSGAVIVTTPQEVSLMDVRKGVVMFQKTNVPILGIIENMTGEVFGRGGGSLAARQFQVPFLGEVPLDAAVRQSGDTGKPIVLAAPESQAARGFQLAADALTQKFTESTQKV